MSQCGLSRAELLSIYTSSPHNDWIINDLCCPRRISSSSSTLCGRSFQEHPATGLLINCLSPVHSPHQSFFILLRLSSFFISYFSFSPSLYPFKLILLFQLERSCGMAFQSSSKMDQRLSLLFQVRMSMLHVSVKYILYLVCPILTKNS